MCVRWIQTGGDESASKIRAARTQTTPQPYEEQQAGLGFRIADLTGFSTNLLDVSTDMEQGEANANHQKGDRSFRIGGVGERRRCARARANRR